MRACVEKRSVLGWNKSIAAVEDFQRLIDIDEYRRHTQNKLIILYVMKLSETPVDNITQFGLSLPELHQLFNKIGDYYC